MISGVAVEIDGRSEQWRLTTRAMMAVERRLDAGFVEIVQALESSPRITTLVVLVAECANDGAGVSDEAAQGIVDTLGLVATIDAIGRVVEAAFPDAKAPAGNGKRAARRK